MDAATLAVRLGHRRHRLSDALSVVLIVVVLVSSFAIPAVHAQASTITSTGSTGLPGIPLATPVIIHPRLISAYAALLAAAMLSLLYLYRGRSFVVYWIGSWLLVAAGLGVVARSYSDSTLGSVLTGLALLFTVSAAGLMRLSVESFPHHPVRWDGRRITAMSAAALWFLVAPFVVPLPKVVLTGTVATAGLLAWSGVGYLHLARQARSAGALVMGVGLSLIGSSHLIASMMSLFMDLGTGQRLSAVTVITTLFVALGMHILVFEDMTDELRLANRRLAGANEEVRRLAITDPLTGCHNRRFFDEVERREIERHRRYGTPLSVVFIDLNHFKRLNDTLGHDRGDAVLWMIGNLLKGQVRQSDYAIRWGGDEFLLLLSCGLEEAQTKASNLKAAFEQERIGAALPEYLGISVGVAPVSPEEGFRAAIREADAQMYGDKIPESGVQTRLG
jgi:diguanylate cyclase (GGDEF)-like protein